MSIPLNESCYEGSAGGLGSIGGSEGAGDEVRGV